MRVFRLIGVASMLGFLTVVPGRTAQGPPTPEQVQAHSQSGSTHPVSPVAVVSWVSAKGSDGMALDLAVVWRGAPGWFLTGEGNSGSGGGNAMTYSTSRQYGNIRVEFTLKDSPRLVTIGNTAVNLGDHNVVLVDGVDDPAGAKVVKSLKVDPTFVNRREIGSVLGRSPEIVTFLRCDLKLDKPEQQKMIDIVCGRLKAPSH